MPDCITITRSPGVGRAPATAASNNPNSLVFFMLIPEQVSIALEMPEKKGFRRKVISRWGRVKVTRVSGTAEQKFFCRIA